ncbi:MAG: translation elongation factor Ts [Chloroflexi bacterium]|nr:translation elongation factor Ts [Chloroflexota bacterium]
MAITTEMIKSLRETTGAGILDCRKALEQSNGDVNSAMDFLREKGLATATKRSGRQASEGVVELYSHGKGRVGVMVELNCETDFVGRSEAFRTLAHELALQIAATSPEFIFEADIPAEVIERETKIATAKAKEDGKPDSVLPRIIEGSIKKFKDEFVLMNQAYVREEGITVQELVNQRIAALGENIIVRRFARWALGETTAEAAEE